MKKCPYCFEEIQDAAMKCRFCGEMQPVSEPASVAPVASPMRTEPFTPGVRKLILVAGIGMIVAFFFPWAIHEDKAYFTWTIMDDADSTASFFVFMLLAGIGLTVLSLVERLSPLSRALGLAGIGVVGVLSLLTVEQDVLKLASLLGGTIGILGFLVAAFGLGIRIQDRSTIGGLVALGLGLLLLFLWYVLPAAGFIEDDEKKSIMSRAVATISDGEGLLKLAGLYLLLPLALIGGSVIGFLGRNQPHPPPTEPYIRWVQNGLLYYIPAGFLFMALLLPFSVDVEKAKALELLGRILLGVLFLCWTLATYFTLVVRAGVHAASLGFAHLQARGMLGSLFAGAGSPPATGLPSAGSPTSQRNRCATCGGETRYVQEIQRHWCDRCGRPVA